MQAEVAVVGSGVVGSATALELARRGAAVALLEAEPEPGLGASGTNSGILHTGFDSVPGELETELILRSAALRDPVLEALRVPVLRCGALHAAGRWLAARRRCSPRRKRGAQRRRGVACTTTARSRCRASRSPIRSPTRWRLRPQPNATARSFAPAFESRGSSERRRNRRFGAGRRLGRCRARRQLRGALGPTRWRGSQATTRSRSTRARASSWSSIRRAARRSSGSCCRCRAKRTKGVLVFPTIDGKVVAGPTAVDQRRQGRLVGPSRGAERSFRKASAMYPPLEDAEPIAAVRRPAAGRPRRQLPDRPVGRLSGPRQRGGDPLHGPHRLAGDRRAGGRDRRASSGWRSAPSASLEPGRRPAFAGPWWRRTAEYRAQLVGRAMSLLLGIDEGTSAVKAVLFDTDLRPVKEARREKALRQPKPGWVEQDAEEVLATVVDAVAELLADDPGEIVACGLDHQGESVLAWDAESGRPLTPIVTWQDKRSQEVLDRLEADGRADEVRERSGMPLDPYFSAGKLTWLLGARRRGRQQLETRAPLRLGTVDSFLCDRLGAGFATDPSTASRTQLGAPEWDPALLEIFGVPAERAARDHGHGRRSRRAAPPLLAGRAPVAGALRRPAGGARRRRLRGARPGQGHLRHRRVRARTRGRRAAGAGRRPAPHRGLAVQRRVEWAIDGGVFTAGALLEWLSRDLGLAADPAALAAAGDRGRGRGRRAGATRAGRRRRPVVGVRGARGGGRADVGNATGPHRAGRAGGDRVAGCGRGRGRARDGARGGSAGRRRPDPRSHAPPAPGRRCRRPRSARRRGCHRGRSGRARRRGSGHLGLDTRDRRAGSRRASAPSQGEMPHGGSRRTPTGASS